jgi:hypothetical protein
LLVLVVGAWGCDRSGDEPGGEAAESAEQTEESGEAGDRSAGESSGPRIVHPDGPAPEAQTVLASGGEVEVTLADYEAFLQRSRLFAPKGAAEVSAQRRANPRLQSNAVRSLLEAKVLDREFERRQMEISDEELREFVASDRRLRRYSGILGDGEGADAGGGVELPEGLGREDLVAVARRVLKRRRLQEAFVADIEEEEIWQAYRARRDRARIAYVEAPNSPTPEEIDRFIEESGQGDGSPIAAYFREHRARYRHPRMAEIVELRPGSDDGEVADKLERAARMMEEGTDPKAVAEKLGLEHAGKGFVVRRENPEAFGGEVGSTGFQTDGPGGAYAWRVVGERESKIPELDRPLRREVASDLLQQSVVESVRERLDPIIAAMSSVEVGEDGVVAESDLKPVRRAAKAEELSVETTDFFGRANGGSVPGLGLAESLVDAVLGRTMEQPVVDEPVLTRGRAVAAMLLERQTPTRDKFEDEKETFAEKYRRRQRSTAIQRFMSTWQEEHDVQKNLKPLRVKYGVLKK